jgi:signal transduction histidine kinase
LGLTEKRTLELAGAHGQELLRLGYTLSHVVHAYGAICQSITETAAKKNVAIAASEFQAHQDSERSAVKNTSTGLFIHEMRNALTSANMSLQMIQKGVVGPAGQTGQALQRSLQRLGNLLEQSVTH